MSRLHHLPATVQTPIKIIPTSARKALSVGVVRENDRTMVELRALTLHPDGTTKATGHRTTVRLERLQDLMAALAAIHADFQRWDTTTFHTLRYEAVKDAEDADPELSLELTLSSLSYSFDHVRSLIEIG